MKLFVYDLIMFRNKKNGSISIETIHTMKNIKGIHICETNNFMFNESNLKVLSEQVNMFRCWFDYNENIEIVGIWRFNIQTKNYEVVYYEN